MSIPAQRIGIYGGTFDPPHLGHLALAVEACDNLHISRLLWVITAHPPHKHKQLISPAEQRVAMVKAAIAEYPCFEISRVDLDRPAPHYAADTIRLLQKQFPGAELIYLIGGDSLRDLPTWRRPRDLIEQAAAFGVMRRLGDAIDLAALEQVLPGISEKVRFIQAPRLEISSRDIRQRIAQGRPYRLYLPCAVADLIDRSGWYASPPTSQTPQGS